MSKKTVSVFLNFANWAWIVSDRFNNLMPHFSIYVWQKWPKLGQDQPSLFLHTLQIVAKWILMNTISTTVNSSQVCGHISVNAFHMAKSIGRWTELTLLWYHRLMWSHRLELTMRNRHGLKYRSSIKRNIINFFYNNDFTLRFRFLVCWYIWKKW